MTRRTFLYPGTNIPVEAQYDRDSATLRLHVSNENLNGVDTKTANAVVEFCKLQCVFGSSWEQARQHLIDLGVDPTHL
jgi:hypothetical protein